MSARSRAGVPFATTAAVVLLLGASTPTATEDTEPAVVGVPPATTALDVAPVVERVAPVLEVVPGPLEMIRRTTDADGAVGHDESSERERFTLSGDVFFEFDSAELTDRAGTELAEIADALADAEPETVAVVGHTDSQADDAYNDALSLDRAETVRDVLADSLDGVEITVEGRGEREPLVEERGSADEVEAARAVNRRVTIEATHEGPADG